MQNALNIRFSKWHGAGNDFVIFKGDPQNKSLDYGRMAVSFCDRHTGIGADGLIVLLPSFIADFRMRIFNADGSEAEMCGNASRCVAAYAVAEGLVRKTSMQVETLAGVRKLTLLQSEQLSASARVDMGKPIFEARRIPVDLPESQLRGYELSVPGFTGELHAVSLGNPHAVFFVDDVEAIDLASIGPLIEHHPLFPQRTNVEFAQVLPDGSVRMRVWERGVGITPACGTGACAVAIAAFRSRRAPRTVTLIADGGKLNVALTTAGSLTLTGPATLSFEGNIVYIP